MYTSFQLDSNQKLLKSPLLTQQSEVLHMRCYTFPMREEFVTAFGRTFLEKVDNLTVSE